MTIPTAGDCAVAASWDVFCLPALSGEQRHVRKISPPGENGSGTSLRPHWESLVLTGKSSNSRIIQVSECSQFTQMLDDFA